MFTGKKTYILVVIVFLIGAYLMYQPIPIGSWASPNADVMGQMRRMLAGVCLVNASFFLTLRLAIAKAGKR